MWKVTHIGHTHSHMIVLYLHSSAMTQVLHFSHGYSFVLWWSICLCWLTVARVHSRSRYLRLLLSGGNGTTVVIERLKLIIKKAFDCWSLAAAAATHSVHLSHPHKGKQSRGEWGKDSVLYDPTIWQGANRQPRSPLLLLTMQSASPFLSFSIVALA